VTDHWLGDTSEQTLVVCVVLDALGLFFSVGVPVWHILRRQVSNLPMFE
jgi:hypothetical protein